MTTTVYDALSTLLSSTDIYVHPHTPPTASRVAHGVMVWARRRLAGRNALRDAFGTSLLARGSNEVESRRIEICLGLLSESGRARFQALLANEPRDREETLQRQEWLGVAAAEAAAQSLATGPITWSPRGAGVMLSPMTTELREEEGIYRLLCALRDAVL